MEQKTFFEAMDPKTAFWVGVVTAVLGLGTIGFIVLGSSVLKGSSLSLNPSVNAAANPSAPSANQPAAAVVPSKPSGPIKAVTKDDHIRGDAGAALTIVEYSDFQCPYCQRFHPVVQKILDANKGKVRWVYRNFPLSIHAESENAAEAAECASEQGKFWEYGDALFANQSKLGDAYYKELAGTLGLDQKKFDDCRASDKTLAKIRQQEQDGVSEGITGTPGSFLIDKTGKVLNYIAGAYPQSDVQSMIDAASK